METVEVAGVVYGSSVNLASSRPLHHATNRALRVGHRFRTRSDPIRKGSRIIGDAYYVMLFNRQITAEVRVSSTGCVPKVPGYTESIGFVDKGNTVVTKAPDGLY